MADMTSMPGLPSQALDRPSSTIRPTKSGGRTVSTSGTKDTETTAPQDRSGTPSGTTVDPTETLAKGLITLGKKTNWQNFEGQLSSLYASATNDDEKLWMGKKVGECYKRIFGGKGMPTELSKLGAYDESKVSQTFRDTGKSLLDTALGYKDMIRGYDRLTKGGVRKTFASAISEDPRFKALISIPSRGSTQAETTAPSHAQEKRQRRKERKRDAKSDAGAEATKGSEAQGTAGKQTRAKQSERSTAATTQGAGTAPTNGATTSPSDVKAVEKKAARQKQISDYNDRVRREAGTGGFEKAPRSSKAISFADTTLDSAGGKSPRTTTAAGTADTRGAASTTNAEVKTGRPHKPIGAKPKVDATEKSTKGQGTATTTPSTAPILGKTTMSTDGTVDTTKLIADLNDPTKFKSTVDSLGAGMTAAARKHSPQEYDKLPPVAPANWSAMTTDMGVKHKARMALNRTITTKPWTVTEGGYTREDTITELDGIGTLRQTIIGGKKGVEFEWKYPCTNATGTNGEGDTDFAFDGPDGKTGTLARSTPPSTKSNLSTGLSRDGSAASVMSSVKPRVGPKTKSPSSTAGSKSKPTSTNKRTSRGASTGRSTKPPMSSGKSGPSSSKSSAGGQGRTAIPM